MASRPRSYPDITPSIHAQAHRFLFIREGESPINDPETMVQFRQAVEDYKRANGFPSTDGPYCCSCVERHGVKCRPTECPKALAHIMCDETCGEACQNQMFDRDWQVIGMTAVPEGSEEYLVADEKLPAGCYIDEFVGEIKKGVPDVKNKKAHPIILPGFGQFYVDASKVASRVHYIAHQKQPNCKVVARVVGDTVKLFVISLRVIGKGEFISVRFPQCLILEYESNMSVCPKRGTRRYQ